MDLFDSPAPAGLAVPARPAWMKPLNAVPGRADLEPTVLIHTEDVVVALTSILVYHNGFEFAVETRLRRTPDPADSSLRTAFTAPLGAEADPFGLRIGMLYSDGRHGSTMNPPPAPGEAVGAQKIAILQGAGAGDAVSWQSHVWFHPLPSDGPISMFTIWKATGAEEDRRTLDGGMIRRGADRSVVFWPGDETRSG